MFEALKNYQFLQNAVVACVLASVICGIIGVVIVEKKLVMMSGGIAHTAYGGVGLGYLLGFEPIYGALGFSMIAAFAIGFFKKKGGAHSDIIIALFWSLGMALGITFIGFMPGYPPDMNSYLFGNILTVTRKDILMMGVVMVVVLTLIVVLFNDWKVFLFDSEYSSIMKVRTNFLEYLMLFMIALTVVVLIRVAGIILVIALLTAPAATAGMVSKNLKNRMIISSILGIIICLCGLSISYKYNIASGATIIILAVATYFAVYLVTHILSRKRIKVI